MGTSNNSQTVFGFCKLVIFFILIKLRYLQLLIDKIENVLQSNVQPIIKQEDIKKIYVKNVHVSTNCL